MKETGKMLACVLAGWDVKNTGNGFEFSPEMEAWITETRQRMIHLQSASPEQISGLVLPKGTCSLDRPFLQDNTDFFLFYLRNAQESGIRAIDCPRLAVHLNNCYPCFDEYCRVLRDYCRHREILSKSVTP